LELSDQRAVFEEPLAVINGTGILSTMEEAAPQDAVLPGYIVFVLWKTLLRKLQEPF